MRKDDDYAYGLDALRLLSALLVGVFHLTWKNPDASWAVPFGWIGVQIFFVISGGVIANSASAAGPRQFLVGRFLRLYPAAWIAGSISFIILSMVPLEAFSSQGIAVTPGGRALLRTAALIYGDFLASSYWTLPIEISFYLLVLLTLFFKGKIALIAIARLLTIASFPYLLAFGLHTVGWMNWPWLDFGYGLQNSLLVRHGPFFALGIYIWWSTSGRIIRPVDVAVIAVAFLLSAIEIAIRSIDLVSIGAPFSLKGMITLSLVIFAFAVTSVYLSMQHRGPLGLPPRVMNSLRVMGLMTYPLYLLHEVVGGFVLHRLKSFDVPFSLRLPAAMFVVCVIAYLICQHAEPWLRTQMKRLISKMFGKTEHLRSTRTL